MSRSRGSSVSIVPGYGLDDRAIEVRSPAGARIFPLASVSRPALGPTQPPVQWVPGVLSLGGKARPGRIPPLPPSASMACSGTALLTFLQLTCQLRILNTYICRHIQIPHDVAPKNIRTRYHLSPLDNSISFDTG
jgi:hypothetical protein